ncbi:15445_t:CDS:2, partial [Gigaspora margarita]
GITSNCSFQRFGIGNGSLENKCTKNLEVINVRFDESCEYKEQKIQEGKNENQEQPDLKDEKQVYLNNSKIESVNKFDEIVKNELNKDLEIVKLKVGDVNENKGKDTNIAKANENVSDDLTANMCKSNIGIVTERYALK